jgi:hypothetical protein
MALPGTLKASRAWPVSLLCVALAVLCVFAPDLIYGARAALVNVRWAPEVDEGRRRALETRYQLTRAVPREGTTWAYYLADPSRRNVRALVTDPAAQDTHYINRSRFTVWRSAARDPYRGRGAVLVPSILALASWLLALTAAGVAFVAVAPGPARALGARIRGVSSAAVSFAACLVPSGTAASVGAFRMVLGACLAAIVVSEPMSEALARVITASTSPLPGFSWLWRVLEWAPAVATWGQAVLLLSLLAFVAGFHARVAYAVACAGLWLWVLMHVARSSHHPYGALLVGVTALLGAPWGDAWSVDAWLRRRAGRGLPERVPAEYGYVTWMPGFVLGICFLAAAIAKLREGGLAWITNGTVKYHFLTDSPSAVVDWGLWLGHHHSVAVAASAAAVAVEAVVIVGALARGYRLRAVAGLASVAILTGFVLFQGLFWPGWWVLALSFLPWHMVRDAGSDGVAAARWSPLRYAPAAIALAIVLEQGIVSAFRWEVPPALSTYDMYSTTYSSPRDYEVAAGMSYWLVARQSGSSDRDCEVSRTAAEAWVDPARRTGDRELARTAAVCFGEGRVDHVVVEGRRTRVDWARWRLAGDEHVVLAGPFAWQPPPAGAAR